LKSLQREMVAMTSLEFDHGQTCVRSRANVFNIFDKSFENSARPIFLRVTPDVDAFLDAEFVGIAGLAVTGQSVPTQVSSTSFSTDD